MKKSIKTILCVILAVSLCAAALCLAGCDGKKDINNTKPPQTSNNPSQGNDKTMTSAPGSAVKETMAPGTVMAADFTVVNAEGSSVKLSSLAGKPVVVNFWATWCAPCVSELPEFQRAYEEYGDRVEFIFINIEADVGKVMSFMQDNGFNFPLYFDLTCVAQEGYSVSSIPMSVFIDPEGHVSAEQEGSMDYDTISGYIEQIIK